MHATFLQIVIGKKKLNCTVDGETPFVEHKKKRYDNVQAVTDVVPELLAPDHIEELAQIANFISSGMKFSVIESIQHFQRAYRQRIWQEQSSMAQTHPRLSDYGVFEVGGMHPPRMQRAKLIFYVEQVETGVPYKAILSLSNRAKSAEVAYETLPEVD